MAKNRKPTTPASWIGTAAHEIRRNSQLDASEAHRSATWLANYLVNKRSEELLDCDPRESTHEFWPVDADAARHSAQAAAAEAWLAGAIYEIGQITTAQGRELRRLAINLMRVIMSKGLRFLDSDPRKAARFHFRPEAFAPITPGDRATAKLLGIDAGKVSSRPAA